jgi:hypothetical protein
MVISRLIVGAGRKLAKKSGSVVAANRNMNAKASLLNVGISPRNNNLERLVRNV